MRRAHVAHGVQKTHAMFWKSRQVEFAAKQHFEPVYCRLRGDVVQSLRTERDAARGLQFISRGTVPRERAKT